MAVWPAIDRPVADWQVAGLGKGSVSLILAGGAWLFAFRSHCARYECLFSVAGVGIGLGYSPSPFPVPLKAPFFAAQFHPIVCTRPFSARELNGADGIIADVGASLGVGYGVVEITAHRGFLAYFLGQRMFGPNLGLGAGMTDVMGVWRHLWGKET